VDAERDRIRFNVLHHFVTGDAVKYAAGGALISASLSESGTFFVRVLDEFTIKLYATRIEAMALDRNFAPSAVDSATDVITLAGHGFGEDTAVTYRAAPAAPFQSTGVDVQVSGDTVTNVDNNQIFIENHQFATGDRVIYRNSSNANVLGLDVGTAYFVIVVNANAIQLSATPRRGRPGRRRRRRAGDPIALTPDKSTAGQQVRHLLERESIGGLENGKTYYARNVTANTFQLATTPGGSPITGLDGANRVGTHAFGRAGFELVGQSGTQSLRLDLTSAPGGNHLLLGPDGVSLRTLSPPPGDGRSLGVGQGRLRRLRRLGRSRRRARGQPAGPRLHRAAIADGRRRRPTSNRSRTATPRLTAPTAAAASSPSATPMPRATSPTATAPTSASTTAPATSSPAASASTPAATCASARPRRSTSR
jgi:hypothetical protein